MKQSLWKNDMDQCHDEFQNYCLPTLIDIVGHACQPQSSRLTGYNEMIPCFFFMLTHASIAMQPFMLSKTFPGRERDFRRRSTI